MTRLTFQQRDALELLKADGWGWLAGRTRGKFGSAKPDIHWRTGDTLTDLGYATQGNRNGSGTITITGKGRRA